MKDMKIYDLLDLCLSDIIDGRRTMEECLRVYPAARRELEPLLKTALLIRKPCPVAASAVFKARTRVSITEYIKSSGRKKSTLLALSGWFGHLPRSIGVALAVFLVLSSSSGGAAYAARDSVPGDSLYGVKLASEQLGSAFIFSSAAKTERFLSLAERRLEEMSALARLGRTDLLETTARRYENSLAAVVNEVEKDIPSGVLEKVSLATSRHVERLGEIAGRVPEKAQSAITSARKASLKGQQRTLLALAKHNPTRAMEISLASMSGILERVSAHGVQQDGSGMQYALSEYEELQALGMEISAVAHRQSQDATAIDRLIAEATAKHVQTLAGVYKDVPDNAKTTIENAMTSAAEEHGKAVDALKDQGVPDNSPTLPSLPTSVPETIKDRVNKAFTGTG